MSRHMQTPLNRYPGDTPHGQAPDRSRGCQPEAPFATLRGLGPRLRRAPGGGVSEPEEVIRRQVPISRLAAQADLGPCLTGAAGRTRRRPELNTPLSLAAARELATKSLRQAKSGSDPCAAKQRARQQERAAECDTLRAISDEYLRREGPRLRTLNQRRADLELLCASVLGRLPVAEITRGQYTPPARLHRRQQRAGALRPRAVGGEDPAVLARRPQRFHFAAGTRRTAYQHPRAGARRVC